MLFPRRKRRTPWDWVRVDLFPASIWGRENWRWKATPTRFLALHTRTGVFKQTFFLDSCQGFCSCLVIHIAMQTTLRSTSIMDKTKLYWKFTPTLVNPLFKPRMGKWRGFFGLLGFRGGGEGGRERVDICFSILFCLRLLLHSATSPLASGFLIKPNIRTFKMQKWNSPALFMRVEGPQLLSFEGPLPLSENKWQGSQLLVFL